MTGLVLIPALGAKPRERLSGRKTDTLFRAYQGERATLSRDGRTLAYVLRGERRLAIAVVDLDQREKPRTVILVEEHPEAKVTQLAWTTDHLLALVTAAPAIYSVDISTQTSRRVLDSATFGAANAEGSISRPPRFIGLVPNEPGMAWVESVTYTPVPTALDMELEASGETLFDLSDLASDSESSQGSTESSPLSSTSSLSSQQLLLDALEPRKSVKWLELVKLDLTTGKTHSVSNLSGSLDGVLLYDRQGQPRILQEQAALKQRFLYRAPGRTFLNKWVELDRWMGKEHPLAFHVTPQNFLGHRSFPLAFDLNPDLLYYASNIGRDTYAIFQINLKDKSTREVGVAPDGFDLADYNQPLQDSALLRDRATGMLVGLRYASLESAIVWTDASLGAVHATLRGKFPGRTVDITEWDDARERFLALVSGPGDPGRYFVFYKSTGECLECVRLAPWLKREEANVTRTFDFVSADGVRVGGRVTLPHASLLRPSPLVIWCQPAPGTRGPSEFSREAQVFADLGCIVLQVEYRGAGGRGVAHREAILESFDRTPLADIIAALEWIKPLYPYDTRRIAIGGEGFGGFLALRALALHPRTFRCAVAVNAPTRLDQLGDEPAAERQVEMQRFAERSRVYMQALSQWQPGRGRAPTPPFEEPPPIDFQREFNRWLYTHGEAARDASVIKDARLITRPVLLLHDPDSPTVWFSHAASLKRALGKQGTSCRLREISGGFAAGQLASRGTAFDAIGEFIAEQFYEFDVEVGEVREQK